MFDLVQLLKRRLGQDETIPVQLGFDETRGKVAIEIGLALDTGGKEMAMLAGNGDGATQERFAGINR